jgi:hypothetical protein
MLDIRRSAFVAVPASKEFHDVPPSYRSGNVDTLSKAKITSRPTSERLGGAFGEESVFELRDDVGDERAIM